MENLRFLLVRIHEYLTDEEVGAMVGRTRTAVQKLRMGTTKSLPYDDALHIIESVQAYLDAKEAEEISAYTL